MPKYYDFMICENNPSIHQGELSGYVFEMVNDEWQRILRKKLTSGEVAAAPCFQFSKKTFGDSYKKE